MSALVAAHHGTAPRASRSPGNPIAVRRAQGRVVVTLHGELDRPIASILERVLIDLIDGQGNLDVVVELADVGLDDPLVGSAIRVPAELARRRGAAFTALGATDRLAALRSSA